MIGRVVVLGVLAFVVAAGPGQAQDTGDDGERARPPAKLTEEFPLGNRRLCCGSGPASSGRGSQAGDPSPPRSSPSVLPFVLVPLAVAAGLMALAVYARSAPGGAYGYSIDVRPRPRRSVSPLVLTLLRPLIKYHYRRDAWILRTVGDRVGPVLRPRDHPARPDSHSPPQPSRIGRFDRAENDREPVSSGKS